MIQINLLPPERRRQKWQLKRMVAGISAVTLLFCILWYGCGVVRLWQTERQFAELTAKHELLRPTEQKMDDAQKKQQVITAKNNTLVNVLTKDRKSWYSIIIYFGAIMPPHVWLNEVAAMDKDTIKITGMAINYPDVANLLQNMEHDDMFSDPVLVKAEYDLALAVTKFEISVKIKGL